MIGDNLKKTKDAMQQLETRMAAEKARIAEFSQSKQDELNQHLQQATLDVQNAEADLKQAEALVLEKKNEASKLNAQGQEIDRETQTAKNYVMGIREQIQRCKQQQNNSLVPYGQNLTKVLERIGGMRWHGQKPLGPLGVYVKLKDRVWADLLRVVLGSHMSSFVVTDPRDLPVLKKELRDSGKCVDYLFFSLLVLMTIVSPSINVFVSKVDLFDYKSGEPSSEYRTILRVLDVS
jgi:chromosome segregation ATPase